MLSGDESGTICARLLQFKSNEDGNEDPYNPYTRRLLDNDEGLDGDGSAYVVAGVHEGGVLVVRHVQGSFRVDEGDVERWSSLFLSGGVGEKSQRSSRTSSSYVHGVVMNAGLPV